MKTLQDALFVEKEIKRLISNIAKQIADNVQNNPLPTVSRINDKCYTVNLLDLKNGIWCPNYYSQDYQALMVSRKLNGATTATDLLQRIQTIIEDEYVKIGTETTRMNENTMRVLKEFVLSQKGDIL